MESKYTATKILFVDDEVLVLQGLKRQLRKLRNSWEMRFAESAEAALKMMEESPADVVVSDMRMPLVDGAELLSQVQELYPSTIRFILSGQTDTGSLMSGLGSIHQFLQKPCDEEVLVRSIERARYLNMLVHSNECAKIASSISSLPVLSSTLKELREAIRNEQGTDRLASIVDHDPGLSCKLLQLVNSAFFGLPRRIESTKAAISLLGTQQLESLAASVAVFDAVGQDSDQAGEIDAIWNASVQISSAAVDLATKDGVAPEMIGQIQIAGMLSHIGRALIMRYLPEESGRIFEQARDQKKLISDAEKEVLGIEQEVLSAYLLGLWAFDDAIIDAILHQAEQRDANGSPGVEIGNYISRARLTVESSKYIDRLEQDQGESGMTGVAA